MNVLVSCILGSSFGELKREATRWAKADQIVVERLRKVLNDFGSPGDADTQRVTAYLAVEGLISATRFYALLEEAKLDACAASAAVRKFDYIIHEQP